MNKKIIKFLLVISLIINLLFLLNWLIYSSNLPEHKLGVLTRNVKIWRLASGSKLVITLPQGLIVKNESPRGVAEAGLFEPYVFSIFVSSTDENIVDYSNKIERGAMYTTVPQD
ncbi:MAG: hypothetical protein ACKPCM_11770 [Pseudanabaena sp.]